MSYPRSIRLAGDSPPSRAGGTPCGCRCGVVRGGTCLVRSSRVRAWLLTRTNARSILEHGFTLWNNYWYAGHYSFVTYSVLYYPLAALLGIRLLAVATVAAAALEFAILVGREFGTSARWSSRTFAVVCSGIVLAGVFPFALGLALALLALLALQRRSRWGFAALAVLTVAASALAFILLAIVTAGVGLGKRIGARESFIPAAALVTVGSARVPALAPVP